MFIQLQNLKRQIHHQNLMLVKIVLTLQNTEGRQFQKDQLSDGGLKGRKQFILGQILGSFKFIMATYQYKSILILQSQYINKMKRNLVFNFADAFCSLSELQNRYPLEAIIYSQKPKLTQEKMEEFPKEAQNRTLSNKKLRPRLQTSFQRDFMKQHASVFCKSYQKFKEFSGKRPQDFQKIAAINHMQTSSDLQHLTVSQVLEEPKNSLSSQEKSQFTTDLQHQEKLNQFLDDVIKHVDSKDSLRFVLIAHEVWMNYVSNDLDEDEIEDLIRFGNSLVETSVMPKYKDLFEDELQNPQMEEFLTQFLKKYCTTIILTITEYFENPYYNQSSRKAPKRLLEREESSSEQDDENFFIPVPYKKRKSSL